MRGAENKGKGDETRASLLSPCNTPGSMLSTFMEVTATVPTTSKDALRIPIG